MKIPDSVKRVLAPDVQPSGPAAPPLRGSTVKMTPGVYESVPSAAWAAFSDLQVQGYAFSIY